jgi:hypothetical protein
MRIFIVSNQQHGKAHYFVSVARAGYIYPYHGPATAWGDGEFLNLILHLKLPQTAIADIVVSFGLGKQIP